MKKKNFVKISTIIVMVFLSICVFSTLVSAQTIKSGEGYALQAYDGLYAKFNDSGKLATTESSISTAQSFEKIASGNGYKWKLVGSSNYASVSGSRIVEGTIQSVYEESDAGNGWLYLCCGRYLKDMQAKKSDEVGVSSSGGQDVNKYKFVSTGPTPWTPTLNPREALPEGYPPYQYSSKEDFLPPRESNVRCSLKLSDGVAIIGTEETADIYKTTDNGINWTKKLDANDEWNISDIRFFIRAQDNSLMCTTTRYGDILRSTDEGENWVRWSHIPADRSVGIVQISNGVILVGPRRADSENSSVFRSIDNGQNFTEITLQDLQQNTTCFIDLGDGNVLAGVGYDGTAKVFKSTDYGLNWSMKADFDGTIDIMDFVEDEGVIYASTKSNAEIYKSTDNGDSWSLHHKFWDQGFLGMFAKLTWNGQDYLLLSGSDQTTRYIHKVLISKDHGATWIEWLTVLDTKDAGGASNIAVIDDAQTTVIVGTGNHATKGRVHIIHVTE